MDVYTLREFRAKTREAFDKALLGQITITRGKKVYTLSCVHNKPKPVVERVHIDAVRVHKPIVKELAKIKPDRAACTHGADPGLCRYAKPGKRCR